MVTRVGRERHEDGRRGVDAGGGGFKDTQERLWPVPVRRSPMAGEG